MFSIVVLHEYFFIMTVELIPTIPKELFRIVEMESSWRGLSKTRFVRAHCGSRVRTLIVGCTLLS